MGRGSMSEIKGLLSIAGIICCLAPSLAFADDPLPSWNDTETKKRIVAFVENVRSEGSLTFITPAERIAVFDNDGTLWTEQPIYVQLAFALDRVKALSTRSPRVERPGAVRVVTRG